MKVYRDETAPLLEHYSHSNLLESGRRGRLDGRGVRDGACRRSRASER